MTWVVLGSDDSIEDEYSDDGSVTVKIAYAGAEYTSSAPNVAAGSTQAKQAKAAGGSSVTIEADLDDQTYSINGVRYSVTG